MSADRSALPGGPATPGTSDSPATPPGPGPAPVRPSRRTSVRTRAARAAGAAAGAASRLLGRGAGEVVAGRVVLRLAPDAVHELAGERVAAVVSATNGKTTTTRMLTAALAARPETPAGTSRGLRGVVSNGGGANMRAGIVTALTSGPGDAVLEVDEMHLAGLLPELAPRVVLLMNLSRDQLDRTAETRQLAAGWRRALTGLAEGPAGRGVVVANADDPLVVWAASAAPRVVWVSVGASWTADARSCPRCEQLLTLPGDPGDGRDGGGDGGGWRCPSCGLARPAPDVVLEGDAVRELDAVRARDGGSDGGSDGGGADVRHVVRLALPGQANRRNAAMAAVAARELGVPVGDALAAVADLGDVAGRYAWLRAEGVRFWLLLAKNPAGWVENFEVMGASGRPLVLAVNAQGADGRDTSWIYDVPFERLRGRRVVVAGERAADLSLRLAVAGVEHARVPALADALRAARALGTGQGGTVGGRDVVASTGAGNGPVTPAEEVDVVGNYTAFQQLRRLAAAQGPAAAAGSRR
ncbi:MurT ligase domain-containing protein [Pseudokineococcus basanitobsidens]|uniref:Lipid II isoglutaminyl synthase (glutamine-hydrolyzing) subunit MurT n=1 Tax=Pseudokineococcus basanitobsidens TaxID=1926649 RepID=A0ABU8RMI3_9ACTN